MELPGASLYTGGSLNLDGINIAPSMGGAGEEEEAEAAEEEERRQQEVNTGSCVCGYSKVFEIGSKVL